MDDTPCREFFSQPTNPYQRQYEALRAVFVEGQPQKQVAQEFGFEYGSLRQLLHQLRQYCRNSADESPFFEN
jgi:DNA-directed RNA polymerase specialized sigma24 family protein